MELRVKNRTISFRVPEQIIEEVEKEAKTKMISTNVLINQILQQYVSWDKYENKIRMFPIPDDIFHHIIDGVDEKMRKDFVDVAFNSIRDWALVSKKRFDIHTCLQVLEEYCRMVGISVEENKDSGRHSFVIRHNLGRNLSAFIGELVEKIFMDLAKGRVDSQLTNTTVVSTLQSRFD